jgi:hypothetical protein
MELLREAGNRLAAAARWLLLSVLAPDELTRGLSARAREFQERMATRLVWGTWLVLTVWVGFLVARYGHNLPLDDELYVIGSGFTAGKDWLDPSKLWAQHNEHRIPVPRIILLGLTKVTRDVRSVLFLNAALLSAAAAMILLAVRRLRGHGLVLDVFVPVTCLGS